MTVVSVSFKADLREYAAGGETPPIQVDVTYAPTSSPRWSHVVLGSGTMTWAQLRNMLPTAIRPMVRQGLDMAAAEVRSQATGAQDTADTLPAEVTRLEDEASRLEAAAADSDQFVV